MGLGRSILSRLALVGLGLVAGVALVELTIRTFDLGPEVAILYKDAYQLSNNPILGYELVPGAPDGAGRFNDDGMRGPNRPQARTDGTTRIAVIGDSIAFGFRLPSGQGFVPRLEERLNRQGGPHYEVLNFGVPGYGITQIAEVARDRALRYEPDIIVYAYCLNDPEEYSLEWHNLRAQHTSAQLAYLDRLAAGWLRTYALARYALASLTGHGGKTGTEHRWDRDDPQFLALRGNMWVQYFEGLHQRADAVARLNAGLDSLASLSQAQGVPVWIAVFPLLRELGSYPLKPVHQQLAERVRRRGLGYLDLTDALRERALAGDQVSLDALHPSALGHQAAAEALHEALRDGPAGTAQ